MKTMIITGASRGIGAATAKLAAARGFAVVVNYRHNCRAAEEVVAEIEAQGGQALAVQADVSREEDVLRLFTETDRQFGSLHSLINNAGILERQMRLEEMDAARLQRVFATNICGPMLCAREAIIRMSTKHGGQGGTMVNVSSIAARTGAPAEYIDYAASKGAIDAFTVGLSKELAEEGIRVNAVRPAFIYTRGGLAQEVAEAILWLASEKSSYSTGIFIDVTGGR